MALFNFLKTTKPIQFDFKPRFYDEEKEGRQQRLKELEGLSEHDTEGIKNRISGGFRRSTDMSALHLRRKMVLRSNLMVMALVMLLALGAFLLLNVYLPGWLNK
ncbi:MAG TPA: hypothetical protein PK198_15320 [Saprospiraceae bacterium]|nr:hypothetical protein [Saprospiraceae bacterium]HRK80238.1 hypothetical protein [Saprospiraceae bacterium]